MTVDFVWFSFLSLSMSLGGLITWAVMRRKAKRLRNIIDAQDGLIFAMDRWLGIARGGAEIMNNINSFGKLGDITPTEGNFDEFDSAGRPSRTGP